MKTVSSELLAEYTFLRAPFDRLRANGQGIETLGIFRSC